MLEHLIGLAPERWREFVMAFLAPIAWVPRLQRHLIELIVDSSSGWTATAKCVVLALPTALVVVAVWCTQLSLYTLPFRSRRIQFVSMMLLTWWDGLYAVSMYWTGVVRIALVFVGWLITSAHLAVKLLFAGVFELLRVSVSAAGRVAGKSFRPGMPWVALTMLVLWCVLEATVFSYTLRPAAAQALEDLVGVDHLPRVAGPILWSFLLLLIMGSFVCIQLLIDAVKKHEYKLIVPLVLVELFVMSFEVVFLYRDLADTIMPWIVQETGGTFHPGLWFSVSAARFGWIGVRGLAWFLFGQYGTPPLLAVIARQPMTRAQSRPVSAPPQPGWWLAHVTHHDWLRARGNQLLEYVGLPLLHLVAATLNFAMVLLTAQPLLKLPFKGLQECQTPRSANDWWPTRDATPHRTARLPASVTSTTNGGHSETCVHR
jgi:hypothetical protein